MLIAETLPKSQGVENLANITSQKPRETAASVPESRRGSQSCLKVPPPRRVAFYCRVSTSDGRQTVENQLADLSPVAERLGWNVVEVLSDNVSGTRGREKRPGYDRLTRAISRREIDLVAAWSADRIARSLSELVAFLAEIQARGVDVYLHRQAVDTSTPGGRALFQMLGVFAEFEVELIRERIKSGLARVKAQGGRLGRPPMPDAVRLRIEDDLRAGNAVKAIARATGVAPVTVRRIRDAGYV